MTSINAINTEKAKIEQKINTAQLTAEEYDIWTDAMLHDKVIGQDSNGNNITLTEKTYLSSGEANFAEYGAALDDYIKDLVTSGDGADGKLSEEEKNIQLALASKIYADSSVTNTNDFISIARGMGYEVDAEYMATDYIIDNKNSASKGKEVTHGGAICVLTITDPATGADIVIADANGNAAIEVEELFMNEILDGLSSQIDVNNFGSTDKSRLDADFSSYFSDMGERNEAREIERSAINLELEMKRKELEEKRLEIKEAKALREAKAKEKQEALKKQQEAKQQIENNELPTNLEVVDKYEYASIQNNFKENLIAQFKENEEFISLSDKELDDMAQEEAMKFMEEYYYLAD